MNPGSGPATAPAPKRKGKVISDLLFRFYRGSLSRFYNYHFYRIHKFVQKVAASVRPGDTLLDVGAGDCQYKPYFAGKCKYMSQDVGGRDIWFTYDQIDIRSEIYEIPLPNESVDVILCTQVMEHLKYPIKALAEMYRLLKPGGRLCITVPFAADEHMIPYDYFRYTRFAWDFMLQDQGFLPPEVSPQGGRFIYMGKNIKDLFPLLTPKLWLARTIWLVQAPIVVPVLFVLYFLDKIDKNKYLTHNYDVIAQKPLKPAGSTAKTTSAST